MTQPHPLTPRFAAIRMSLQTPHVPLALRLAGLRPVIEAIAQYLLVLFGQLEEMFAQWQAGALSALSPAAATTKRRQTHRPRATICSGRPRRARMAHPQAQTPAPAPQPHSQPRAQAQPWHPCRVRIENPVPQWPPSAA